MTERLFSCMTSKEIVDYHRRWCRRFYAGGVAAGLSLGVLAGFVLGRLA